MLSFKYNSLTFHQIYFPCIDVRSTEQISIKFQIRLKYFCWYLLLHLSDDKEILHILECAKYLCDWISSLKTIVKANFIKFRWNYLWWEGRLVNEVVLRMMTSSNGNIFRVTGPLCGEFTGPGEFPTQRPVTRSLMFSMICAWTNGWVNKLEAGDLGRHRGNYDVNIMVLGISVNTYCWLKAAMAAIHCCLFLPLLQTVVPKPWMPCTFVS